MTKEQEIYRNMKASRKIYKAYGKYGIRFSALYCAIKEAGYNNDTIIRKIIQKMENNGYIRKSKGINGQENFAKYIILKWVN